MIIVVMGVSGCGKSTVGRALAESLGWRFIDADDHHPEANIRKMAHGIPLDDDDRRPWLEALRSILAAEHAAGRSAVLACSALKEAYRVVLKSAAPEVAFVHLRGTYDEVLALMKRRTGHFMKPDMLASQFATLEPPRDAVDIPVLLTPAEQVVLVKSHLGL